MDGSECLCRAAAAAFDGGDFSRAAAAAEYGLRANPDHGRLWELHGLALAELGDRDAALRSLERSSVYIPLAPIGQIVLAECYEAADKPELAHTILTFLAEPDRCPPVLLSRVASGLGKLGAYRDALEVCENLANLRPTYHPAWFGIAFYRRKLGRPAAEIVSPIFTAHQLAPEAMTYRLNLAAVCGDLGWDRPAYEALRGVPAEVVLCPRLVSQFIGIFARSGDRSAVAEYETWLGRMAEYRPRSCGDCSGPDSIS